MTRLHLAFECQGKRCGATLDNAPGTTGLLLVSGGNEIRAGAFNGQARLAAEIAGAGFPVFRFDRRGIGDSEGENRGFRKSRKDIAAALLAFRAIAPQVERVVGFGNCDASSALMLASGAGCDALVLSNPWTIEDDEDDTPPPSAIRSRYAEKLKSPRELMRLVSGKVDLKKLARGLLRAGRTHSASSSLAEEMRAGLAEFAGDATILLAEGDRTAQVFVERWDADDARIMRCPGADHAYSSEEARRWLRQQILTALRAQRVK
ncbi:hydrolase 1, exosortase A system-associated [Erythrobacter sp.]|uniref:hydrolase 1, exosortase A system-associated n=1 Tax=Erythrobacter sp. TaxID=1042 RepID=UPI001B113503|nr:hydrolase 1, exosortase A system-associated [Erythrobacter sp.]MBO6526168.1 hydrolase 1, exosortase A system-associated [Erythrobacter sp.]MBO6530421.1 hydrolase 1, exosortase A system-associated [Erythrobacter sp.]